MSTVITFNRNTPPVELNGRLASFKLVTDTYETDVATNTEILTSSLTQQLFGESKATLLEKYREQRRVIVKERPVYLAESQAEIDRLNALITDIQNA
jgi:hypothetical protein